MVTNTFSREQVVERILATFRRYGYDGASLARLSEATGLGRSSLYHYFPHGKEDMANAALDFVAQWFGNNVLATLEGPEPAATRLKKFSAKLAEYYKNGSTTCLADVFTIGEAGSIFQQKMRERLQHLMHTLAKTATENGIARAEASRRAEAAVIAIQGSLVVSRALGDTGPFLRVIKNLPRQLGAR